jgi:hypothetical protein
MSNRRIRDIIIDAGGTRPPSVIFSAAGEALSISI